MLSLRAHAMRTAMACEKEKGGIRRPASPSPARSTGDGPASCFLQSPDRAELVLGDMRPLRPSARSGDCGLLPRRKSSPARAKKE
jgi:hypothetical protein